MTPIVELVVFQVTLPEQYGNVANTDSWLPLTFPADVVKYSL